MSRIATDQLPLQLKQFSLLFTTPFLQWGQNSYSASQYDVKLGHGVGTDLTKRWHALLLYLFNSNIAFCIKTQYDFSMNLQIFTHFKLTSQRGCISLALLEHCQRYEWDESWGKSECWPSWLLSEVVRLGPPSFQLLLSPTTVHCAVPTTFHLLAIPHRFILNW